MKYTKESAKISRSAVEESDSRLFKSLLEDLTAIDDQITGESHV